MKIRFVEASSFHGDERTEGHTDRRDDVNSRIWTTPSRCAGQSLANTVYTNTTHTSYTLFFTLYYVLRSYILTVIRWNTGAERKLLQKIDCKTRDLFCSTFTSVPIFRLMMVNVFYRSM